MLMQPLIIKESWDKHVNNGEKIFSVYANTFTFAVHLKKA